MDKPLDGLPRHNSETALQECAAAISSLLADGTLEAEQACFLPLSPDNLPVIGKVPGISGVYIASGGSCPTFLA